MRVPYHQPYLTGNELHWLQAALEEGAVAGDGPYTKKVQNFLAETYQFKHIYMTTSGTHALELAMLLLDLTPEDEVIMPSFTFPSTANAVLLRGARPVFAEIEADTLDLDPVKLSSKITSRTKAIIPVHYGGIGCRMAAIGELAAKYRLTVVEDAAQGVHASYRGRYLGSWGDIGCLSFHGTKNFIAGEGGAIILNTTDHDKLARVELMLHKGTNRRQFLQGQVDKYCWMELGSSYTPSDLLMAVLYAQLMEVTEITKRRKAHHHFYTAGLQKYADDGLIRITTIPVDCTSNYHLFYLLFRNETERDRVQIELRMAGIEAVIHYLPLHSSPMGQRLGYRPEDLPVTEQVSRTLLRLPMSTGLKQSDLEYVILTLQRILEKMATGST